jgi:hypothetical protein
MFKKTLATAVAFAGAVLVALPSVGSATTPAPSPSTSTSCSTSCQLLSGLSTLQADVLALVPAGSLQVSLRRDVDSAATSVSAGNLSTAANWLDTFGVAVTAANRNQQFLQSSVSNVLKTMSEALSTMARKG